MPQGFDGFLLFWGADWGCGCSGGGCMAGAGPGFVIMMKIKY